MRVKPNTGFVEIDVPISTEFYYNRQRAKQWGKALNKSKVEGADGYGLAAGFLTASALRAPAPAPGQGGRKAADRSGLPHDSDDEQEEHPMQHQTLGGQILRDEPGKPTYMVGAFRGGEFASRYTVVDLTRILRGTAPHKGGGDCSNASAVPPHRRENPNGQEQKPSRKGSHRSASKHRAAHSADGHETSRWGEHGRRIHKGPFTGSTGRILDQVAIPRRRG